MKVKFEPTEDIKVSELALILKIAVPFCHYAEMPKEIWEQMPIEVRRHFDVEEPK